MVDTNAQAAHRRGIAKVGVSVTFTRVAGVAPNTTTTTATLLALVRNVQSDSGSVEKSGFSGSKVGSITQSERQVIVIADDLTSAGFPLPIVKGDKVALPDMDRPLTVIEVDAYKRAMAGAIEVRISGVP